MIIKPVINTVVESFDVNMSKEEIQTLRDLLGGMSDNDQTKILKTGKNYEKYVDKTNCNKANYILNKIFNLLDKICDENLND